MEQNIINEYGTPMTHIGRVAIYGDINMPPVKWLIHGLLKVKGIGSIYGSNGTMKSYTAIDLACRMANGMDFHGRTMEQGDVVYIAGEGEDEIKERIDAWCLYYGAKKRPLILPWSVNIGVKGEMSDLTDAIHDLNAKDRDVKLVIFDTLSDCSSGVSLNDPDMVNDRLKPALIDFVRSTRASLLLVHHTGHNESHERGAKVLRDMTDTTIKVSKNNAKITWTVEKLRRAKNGEKINFSFKEVSDQVGIENALIITAAAKDTKDEAAEPIEAPASLGMSNSEKLIDLVRINGGQMPWRDAAKTLDWWNEDKGKATSSYYEAVKTVGIVKDGIDLVLR